MIGWMLKSAAAPESASGLARQQHAEGRCPAPAGTPPTARRRAAAPAPRRCTAPAPPPPRAPPGRAAKSRGSSSSENARAPGPSPAPSPATAWPPAPPAPSALPCCTALRQQRVEHLAHALRIEAQLHRLRRHAQLHRHLGRLRPPGLHHARAGARPGRPPPAAASRCPPPAAPPPGGPALSDSIERSCAPSASTRLPVHRGRRPQPLQLLARRRQRPLELCATQWPSASTGGAPAPGGFGRRLRQRLADQRLEVGDLEGLVQEGRAPPARPAGAPRSSRMMGTSSRTSSLLQPAAQLQRRSGAASCGPSPPAAAGGRARAPAPPRRPAPAARRAPGPRPPG